MSHQGISWRDVTVWEAGEDSELVPQASGKASHKGQAIHNLYVIIVEDSSLNVEISTKYMFEVFFS